MVMRKMNRRRYWDKKYAQYWKEITDEAEEKNGADSKVAKLSGHDYKTPDIEVMTAFFDRLIYNQGDKLLDYGCGLGRFYPYFSGKCDYYGIDISQAMIDECIKKYPMESKRFIVSEGESLLFSDHFFDKVICNGVFDACYQEQALAEMLRVSKVGGFLLISGKNDNYYQDDEEAYIAEVNARKKGHPNYFTNVADMIRQIREYCDVVHERYALRRGDFGKNKFVYTMPECFYEWEVIVRKDVDVYDPFVKFSDVYSKTWKKRNA